MRRPSFVLFLILALPRGAAPQQAQSTPLTTRWEDGFVIESADQEFRIQFGAVAQVDGRFSVDDHGPITNTFTLRKARPIVAGRVTRHFSFRLMPEFGGGNPVILDAYVDMRLLPGLRLRAGKDKTPVGYELLIGDANLFFPERALPSGLVPNRDVGFQAQGELFRQKLTYSAGVFNGIPDGVGSSADVDTNGGKDLAGRLMFQPFRGAAPAAATPVSGLGFHLGGSTGGQRGVVPSYRTSLGQTYFAYAAAVEANGPRRRLTPAVFYFYRSFGAFAEYVRSTQEVLAAGVTREISNDGYEVTGSFLMTGETASSGTIRPLRPFDPENGEWGAVQVLARYARLRVDGDAFTYALAAPGASGGAASFTLGVNWYPTSFIKWYATYERTKFDRRGEGPRQAENAVLFRAQIAF